MTLTTENQIMSYRVVYGESLPAWERIFHRRYEARAFAKRQKELGDVIFSIKKVVAGEEPQSIAAAIAASQSLEAPPV